MGGIVMLLLLLLILCRSESSQRCSYRETYTANNHILTFARFAQMEWKSAEVAMDVVVLSVLGEWIRR